MLEELLDCCSIVAEQFNAPMKMRTFTLVMILLFNSYVILNLGEISFNLISISLHKIL